MSDQKSNCCCGTGNVCPTHGKADYTVSISVDTLRQLIEKLEETNGQLRAKCSRQRTELRRLNKTLRAMWDGVRFSQKVQWGQERALAAKAKREIKEAQQ